MNQVSSLNATSDLLKLLLDNTQEIFIVLDTSLQVVVFNEEARRLIQQVNGKVLVPGLSILSVVRRERLEKIENICKEVLQGKEVRFKHDITGKLTFSVAFVPIYVSGIIKFISVSAIDISSEEQALCQISRSRQLLQQAENIAGLSSWEWDIPMDKVVWSDQLYRLLEIEPGSVEPSKELGFSFLHPDDVGLAEKILLDSFKSGDPYSAEIRLIPKNGELKYIFCQGIVLRNEQGRNEKMIGTFHDITKNKLLEESIHKKDRRFQSLVEYSADLIMQINKDRLITFVSPAITSMMQYQPEEVLGTRLGLYAYPGDLPELLLKFEKMLGTSGVPHTYEYRVKRKDGNYVWVEGTITNLLDIPGVDSFVLNQRDISARKEAESLLKSAEEELKRLSLIAKETVNSVIITDASGRISWVNQAFTNITGYTYEEALGHSPGELLQGPETNPIMKRFMRQKIARVEQFECDVLNYDKSKRKYWVRIQCQPQFDDKGRLVSFFAIQTDITKEKEALDLVRSSEEKYRNLFNNNPSSIFIWDPSNLAILEINDAAMEEYGYSREEFLQMSVTDLNANGTGEEIRSLALNLLINDNFKSNAVWQHVTKSGCDRYMDITFQPFNYYGRKASLAIVNNITEQIELEIKLSSERLKRQQEITTAVITAQEQEREELGRELHDNINQILATTRLYIEYAQTNEAMRDELLVNAKGFIISAVNEIRNLSKSLSPPSLGEVGLIVALEELCDNIRTVRKFTFHTEWKGLNEGLISDKLKLTIFRIIQEQLNNIIKHAMAETVWIKIKMQNRRLLISVKDDGQGFNMVDRGNGVGLKNIGSRAELHNGTMQMHSEPGKGCELKVSFSL